MTGDGAILIEARVHRAERPAVAIAAEMIARALETVPGGRRAITVRFDDFAAPAISAEGASDVPDVYLASLLPALDQPDRPLADIERRWTDALVALGKRGAPVLLCNLFRHVPGRGPMLTRLRELNLLAVRLSHRLGVHVADLDRVMSYLGGRALACDYRLSGARGADAAGYAIAHSLLCSGLDQLLDPALIEAARHHSGELAALPGRLLRRERERQAAKAVDG